jgi:hypothetical protein
MSEQFIVMLSGFLAMGVAVVMLLLIVPAASASARQLKPGWRSAIWTLVFGTASLASLSGTLIFAQFGPNGNALALSLFELLAGLFFTFLTLEAVYRAIPDHPILRYTFAVWITYGLFAIAVALTDSFLPVLFYDMVCAILVFSVYGYLYARQRDRASDAPPIMVGIGFVLAADLIAVFAFRVDLGIAVVNQLALYNLLMAVSYILFFKGASASYSVKYDQHRSRERALSSQTTNYEFYEYEEAS